MFYTCVKKIAQKYIIFTSPSILDIKKILKKRNGALIMLQYIKI